MMKIFKAPNNDTCLSEVSPDETWAEISSDELHQIIEQRRVSSDQLTTLEKLAKLDAENTLTQRNLREFILLTVEAIKLATNNAVDLSQVRGVSVVAAVEAQATVLRAQL